MMIIGYILMNNN